MDHCPDCGCADGLEDPECLCPCHLPEGDVPPDDELDLDS